MILTIGPGGCGFTFLNWSITYLTGAASYKTLNNLVVPVDINPLIGPTAHGFEKDHIRYSKDLRQLENANEQSVIYITPSHQYDIDYLTRYTCKKIIFQAGNSNQELLARFCTINKKNEFVKKIENLYHVFGTDATRQILLEHAEIFVDYYKIPENFQGYQLLYYQDLFQNLDKMIESMFDFLGLKINPLRMDQWCPLYFDWKNRNQGFLKQFLDKRVEVDTKTKFLIRKELLLWKIGHYQPT